MKKLLALFLACALGFTCAACGASESSQASPVEEETTETEATTEDVKDTSEKDESLVPTTEAAFSEKGSIDETVLLNENDIIITATDLSYNDYSAKLNLLIENNSDKNITVLAGTLGYSMNSVNGYMVDEGYINSDIPAGKKSKESMEFAYEELSPYGIKEIAELGIAFAIEDDDYNDILQTGPITIKTSISNSYDYSSESFRKELNEGRYFRENNVSIDYFTEEELYSRDGIKILSAALLNNQYDEDYLVVEVENQSPAVSYIEIENIAFDGVSVCSSTWSRDAVAANKRALLDINISGLLDNQALELLGLTEVNTISFNLVVVDKDYKEIIPAEEVKMQINGADSHFEPTADVILEENGIRVFALPLVMDDFSYSNDMHLYLVIENNTGAEIMADNNSASINGFMIDVFSWTEFIPSGHIGILDVELQEGSLEENDISGIDDVENLELVLVIKNMNYKEILNQTIVLEY